MFFSGRLAKNVQLLYKLEGVVLGPYQRSWVKVAVGGIDFSGRPTNEGLGWQSGGIL